jgi:site-specific recombinase XerD
LLEVVRDAIRLKHYSPRTEETYVAWIRRFIHFHGWRHPRELGASEVTAFLNHLVRNRDVAAATQNQALSALLFLYREVLAEPLAWLDGVERAKRPARVPTVLSTAEIAALLSRMTGTKWLMASLLYGAGLRLRECQTVQELPGHSSVETTMVYSHVMNKGGRGVRSALDRTAPAQAAQRT